MVAFSSDELLLLEVVSRQIKEIFTQVVKNSDECFNIFNSSYTMNELSKGRTNFEKLRDKRKALQLEYKEKGFISINSTGIIFENIFAETFHAKIFAIMLPLMNVEELYKQSETLISKCRNLTKEDGKKEYSDLCKKMDTLVSKYKFFSPHF